MQPINPLDAYRSYAYEFIIVAANSTEAVRNMMEGGAFLPNVSGAVLGQQIKDKNGNDSGCFLIVDTRKVSEFLIDSLTFDSYIGTGKVPSDAVTLITGIHINLTDPSGVGFFNYFKYLVDQQFQTDITGITFLVHIMFVGHPDVGQPIFLPDYSLSIPCIMGEGFNLADYGPRGGQYELNLYPINLGGVSFLSAYNQLFEAIPFKSPDSTLGTVIQSFENELNRRSATWYEKFNPVFYDPATGKPMDNKEKRGRLVQYMITIPDDWWDFVTDNVPGNDRERIWNTALASAQAAAEQQQAKEQQQAPVSQDCYHTIHANTTIEQGLTSILTSCNDIMALSGKNAKGTGEIVFWKTLTSVTSDQETVLVHYDIVKYSLPNVEKQQQIVAQAGSNTMMPNRKNKITPKNSMTFEYIFSGHNSDILDMNIKVNNLWVGLMSQANVGLIAKQNLANSTQAKKPDVGDVIDKDPYTFVSKLQPLPPPPKSKLAFEKFVAQPNKHEGNGVERMSNLQEFYKALSDMHVPSMNNQIKIRGNPGILKRYSVDVLIPHRKLADSTSSYVAMFLPKSNQKVNDLATATAWKYDPKASVKHTPAAGATVSSAHAEHRAFIETWFVNAQQNQINEAVEASSTDNTVTESYLSGATWAKVNIYGPKDYPFAGATDTSGHLSKAGNDFRVQLFYDSWYFVSKISNVFDHGQFTQTLELHAADMYGSYGIAEQPNPAGEKTQNANATITQSTAGGPQQQQGTQ